MVTILNTSILTAFGSFRYTACTHAHARMLVAGGFVSAVGHESTAKILSTLLGVEVPVNRIEYRQEQGTEALVFKLRARAPEGKILTSDEIEAIGYDFGVLTRTDRADPDERVFRA